MADQQIREKTGERIAKVIARAGLCSRREAETWIGEGRVTVNGAVIESPALNVGSSDQVTVDGKPLPLRERTRLFLYYKPRGLVTTHADPEGRPTIFQSLPKDLPRLISVGRLDLNTEGLLLLTNDGGLARTLELPATGWLRRYRVRAFGEVTQDALDRLRNGITIDGARYGAIEATLDRVQGSNVWLTFAIREGKNREVRNVLGALGLQVNRLLRLSFGPFQLGELPEGGIEEVGTRVLREQLGERIAKAAGVDFGGPRNEQRGEVAEQARRDEGSIAASSRHHASKELHKTPGNERSRSAPPQRLRNAAANADKPGVGRGRHLDERSPPARKRRRPKAEERRSAARPTGKRRR